MREQRTKAEPTFHCDRSNDLTSRTSSGIEVLTKLEPRRERSSESSSFKRNCPFWGRKKRAAKISWEEAASKSRLCVEAAHESPISAVRKPAPREETLGWDLSEESAGAKPGCSLLRKLLCLKAASSRPKQPPCGPGASPLCSASARCGPVGALSRTADPEGESPLRWKPRAETQSPADTTTSGGMEVEAEATVATAKPEGSWVTKPWRTFRLASRVKKRSIPPGIEDNHRAAEDGGPYIPPEPETSSTTKTNAAFGKQLSNMAAVEDQKPSRAFPANMDNAHSIQENRGKQRISWHGLEIHRMAKEDSVEADTEAAEGKSISLTLDSSYWNQNLVQKNIPEWESLQALNLPGGNRAEAQGTAMEDEDPEAGRCDYWVGLAEEVEDLGDLAENPGGQGMLMATRDLGWLNSELLGGPKSWRTEWKMEREIQKTQESGEEKAIIVNASEKSEHGDKTTAGLVPDTAHLVTSNHYKTLEPKNTLFPQEGELSTPLEWCPSSFPTKGLKQGLLSPPPSKPCEAVAADNERESQEGKTSPTRKLLSSAKETPRATTWPDTTVSGTEQDKQLIYMAAVEIVGAAIDAAAVQLAKKEEEQAELGLCKHVP